MQEQTPAIETLALTKRYGRSAKLALDSLNMTVYKGEIFGFLGPNGAGKTTTIRLLLDLLRPTAGHALIMGLNCRESSLQVRGKIGYLPGELSLYSNITGNKLLKLLISLRPNKLPQEYVESLCKILDVDLNTPLGRLSHGSRQKIGLVIALIPQPELLILDEPTTGLDPLAQHQVMDLLKGAKAEGRTVFFSSHTLPDVEQICDRVGIIRQGYLVAVEEVQVLRKRLIQRIRIDFAETINARSFSSLTNVRIVQCEKNLIYLEVTGEADAVVKTASEYHVTSIESEHSSLEDIFMTYYQSSSPDTKEKEETNA